MNVQEAFNLGFDCGKNGANKENCHFSIFSQKDFTDAWMKGKQKGETPAGNFKIGFADYRWKKKIAFVTGTFTKSQVLPAFLKMQRGCFGTRFWAVVTYKDKLFFHGWKDAGCQKANVEVAFKCKLESIK